ncbi:MAG: rRNA maturation RNase YbeY [Actinomycetia bacterium]|nr:rRNA maturation RNase YbeY [Actinomycetes bacterium]
MNIVVSGTTRADVDEAEVAEFVESILRQESVADDSTLSVTFIDTAAMSDLNVEHMSKQGPTDVLSFPIEDAAPGHPPTAIAGGPPLDLGDIFICEDVVEAHAVGHDVAFIDELHLMVVHGVLHILGWDHHNDVEAEAMELREAQYLSTIGLTRR